MGSSDQISTLHHVQDHRCPCLSCCCPGCCLCCVQAKVPQAGEAWLHSGPGHPILGKLKLPGTTAGTPLISRAVLLGFSELLTVDFVSVMFSAGWDSWSAR